MGQDQHRLRFRRLHGGRCEADARQRARRLSGDGQRRHPGFGHGAGGSRGGRHALRRRVAAITAEAKWSGRFLSVFPLAAAAALLAINPAYFAEVSGEGFFQPLMAVVGLLLVANIFFMRAMVDLKP